jgi:hypothetical protein
MEMLQTELEGRCTACRRGLVCADQWAAWYGRADEVEAAYRAEHGSRQGLEASEEWQILLDERPTCDEETDCVECDGTGIILTDTGRTVLAWARQRLEHSAA